MHAKPQADRLVVDHDIPIIPTTSDGAISHMQKTNTVTRPGRAEGDAGVHGRNKTHELLISFLALVRFLIPVVTRLDEDSGMRNSKSDRSP